jgi:hypothetical protein
MQTNALKALLMLGVWCVSAVPATAQQPQSANYIGGTGFADINLFGGSGATYYSLGEGPSLNSTGAGGGLRIGTFLHSKVSLEFAVDAGTKTRTAYEYPVIILAIYPPPPSRQLKASTQFTTFTTSMGFHPAARGRLRLGYFAGLSFVRASYTSDLPGYILPAATFEQNRLSYIPISLNGSVSSPVSVSLPSPIYDPRPVTRRDLTGGTMLGFEAAFDVGKRVAIVPEVRAVMFAQPNDGPGVFLIRPGVGVRWGF